MAAQQTIYAHAKVARDAVLAFSANAQIIFDPSVVPQGGWQGVGSLDPVTGVTRYAVPADTKDDQQGAYMLYGTVAQPDLAVPPGMYQTGGAKAKPGEKVTGYV